MVKLLLLLVVSCALWVFYKKTVYSFYVTYPKHIHFYKNKTYTHFKWSFFVVFLFLIYVGIYHVYSMQSLVAGITIKKYFIVPLAACFAFISCIDFKLYLVPFTPLLLLFLLACLYQTLIGASWLLLCQNVVVVGIFLLIIHYTSKKTVGLGDIYLLFILGFWFGIASWLWLLWFSCLFGVLFSLANYYVKRQWVSSIAFAPWISINAWLFFLIS